jgi:hypothetical protein
VFCENLTPPRKIERVSEDIIEGPACGVLFFINTVPTCQFLEGEIPQFKLGKLGIVLELQALNMGMGLFDRMTTQNLRTIPSLEKFRMVAEISAFF